METSASLNKIPPDPHDDIFQRKIMFSVNSTEYAGSLQSISRLGVLVSAEKVPRNIEGQEILINVLNNRNEIIGRKARVEWSGKKTFGAEFI